MIKLTKKVDDKIKWLVNKAPGEISGLGAGRIIDGHFVVFEVYVPKQKCSAASTVIEDQEINKANYRHFKDGHGPSCLFHWHSHASMRVFWSETDRTMLAEWMAGENAYFFAMVTNKAGERLGCYLQNAPVPLWLEKVEVNVLEEGLSEDEVKALEVLYDENVKTFGEDIYNKITSFSEEYNLPWDYTMDMFDKVETLEAKGASSGYIAKVVGKELKRVEKNVKSQAQGDNSEGYSGKWKK